MHRPNKRRSYRSINLMREDIIRAEDGTNTKELMYMLERLECLEKGLECVSPYEIISVWHKWIDDRWYMLADKYMIPKRPKC